MWKNGDDNNSLKRNTRQTIVTFYITVPVHYRTLTLYISNT